jgi:SAM-dependent MidA family methyltransferase
MRTATMRAANAKYYSSKGSRIYSDFSTFAQGRALARANAIEFCRVFGKRAGKITVCEYGVGNGNFAKVFLDAVQAKDASLYKRLNYHLFDFSGKMLASSKRTLVRHTGKCSFSLFDASSGIPSLPFGYCRINELLSDLPASMQRKGNRCADAAQAAFLLRMPDSRQIPFPIAAARFISSLCRLGSKSSMIDIFDYGFYFPDDILRHPRDEWDRLVARKYGSQVTADLNFPYLAAFIEAEGFECGIEPQRAYCERALGMKLKLSQTSKGLDYVPALAGDFKEDDGFYHMRIGGMG